jgi:hypothetical protein
MKSNQDENKIDSCLVLVDKAIELTEVILMHIILK